MEKVPIGTEVFLCHECGKLISKDADYVVVRKDKSREIRNHAACAEKAR